MPTKLYTRHRLFIGVQVSILREMELYRQQLADEVSNAVYLCSVTTKTPILVGVVCVGRLA